MNKNSYNGAGAVAPAATCSPSSCLQCRHHAEYMTHLTATVRCRYPRERAPEVVDMTIFLHGNAVMPLKTAVICPHFEAAENNGDIRDKIEEHQLILKHGRK